MNINTQNLQHSKSLNEKRLFETITTQTEFVDTNGYHANMLFRRLINYTLDNNFTYNIYDEQINDYVCCDLIDESLKESFYKFCAENS